MVVNCSPSTKIHAMNKHTMVFPLCRQPKIHHYSRVRRVPWFGFDGYSGWESPAPSKIPSRYGYQPRWGYLKVSSSAHSTSAFTAIQRTPSPKSQRSKPRILRSNARRSIGPCYNLYREISASPPCRGAFCRIWWWRFRVRVITVKQCRPTFFIRNESVDTQRYTTSSLSVFRPILWDSDREGNCNP